MHSIRDMKFLGVIKRCIHYGRIEFDMTVKKANSKQNLTARQNPPRQASIQGKMSEAVVQGEHGAFPKLTGREQTSIKPNSHMSTQFGESENDLAIGSFLALLDSVAADDNQLVARVREAIMQPDEDDEKEDKKEAKKTKRLLEKIKTRILPYWNVDALRGEYGGRGEKTFGVKITSKLFERGSRTYTLDYIEDKSQAVINDLRNMGPFRPSDYEYLVEYIRLLMDEGKVTQVDSLSDQLNNCFSKLKANELFDFMITKVVENLDFFPKLSSPQFVLSMAVGDKSTESFGVQLDTKEYVDRFGLDLVTEDVVAFGVTTKFLTDIFELPSHRVAFYRTMVRSWYQYGLLSHPATYHDRYEENVNVGGYPHRFYLFRVRNFIAKRAIVKSNLRQNDHE